MTFTTNLSSLVLEKEAPDLPPCAIQRLALASERRYEMAKSGSPLDWDCG